MTENTPVVQQPKGTPQFVIVGFDRPELGLVEVWASNTLTHAEIRVHQEFARAGGFYQRLNQSKTLTARFDAIRITRAASYAEALAILLGTWQPDIEHPSIGAPDE